MRAYYNVLKVLSDFLKANLSINSVSIGDLSEVDLKKQRIYPLAHIIPGNISFGNATIIFNLQIIVADNVYEAQNDIESEIEPLKGNNNIQDVLNTTLTVINALQTMIRINNIENSYYKLASDPTADRFEDRFEDLVAGWVLNLSIEIPNADINICEYTDLPSIT